MSGSRNDGGLHAHGGCGRWAMGDGTNQPTPLVHDGVIYLANPGNVIQARDAAEGTLLWEYKRHGRAQRAHGRDRLGDSDCRLPPGIHQRGRPHGRQGQGAQRYQWGGVDVWNTGSYDPELGLVYWGTAQAKP